MLPSPFGRGAGGEGLLPNVAPSSTQSEQFSVTFPGANLVAPTGMEQAATTFNYLIGDQSQWHTNVPSYQEVAYDGLYAGIDLVTWGRRDSLKYEFHVAPGADYRQIRIHYDGIEGLAVDAQGVLHVQTALGQLTDDAPFIYQQIGGRQVAVAGRFNLLDADTYTFAITGVYDPARELVIDPVLAWSTYLGGGSGGDFATSIAVDAAGNAYVTGYTNSYDFSTTAGAFQTTYDGGLYGDAFVTKLNAAGSGLLYSTFLGGSGGDDGHGIAVDAAGNAYVTGNTNSSDFPTTAGAFQTTCSGNTDGFLTKLNASGSGLVYSTYLRGGAGQGIGVDAAGNAYVTGEAGSEFPTTAGAFETTLGGNFPNAFVTKLNAAGSGLVYSTYLGGSGWAEGYGIAVDATGNAYVTGFTGSTNFPTTVGALDTTTNGGQPAFVAKFGGFTLAAAPTITSVTPSQPQATDGNPDLTIIGTGFDGSAHVELIDNGGVVHQLTGARILSLSSTQITINPNFTSAGVGTWKAQVVNGSGQVSGWFTFQVIAAVLAAPSAPVLSNNPPIWDTTAPAAPALYLHWTPSSGNPAPLYDLYRNGTLVSANAANLSQTSFYKELGLLLGQTYTYYVVAHNSAGSTQSNTINVPIPTSLGTTMPGVPTGLTASATSAILIHLAWTAVSAPGVTYLVYRGPSSTGPWILLQRNVPQASFDDVYSVQPSSTYYYAVASANAGGTSNLSLPAFATTPSLTKPAAPTIVSAVPLGTNQIVLMWTGVLAAGQYILERADSTNGSYKTVQTFDFGTTSYTDTLTAPSTVATTYSYRIDSLVNGVKSDPSSVVPATLSVPVNNKQVQSSALPPLAATVYYNVAQVYKFNGSTWTSEVSPTDLHNNIDWTLPTVILTHGWMDSLAGCTYITQFASQFWQAHPSGYNVLAVDWSSAGNVSLGSNPDGATWWLPNLWNNNFNLNAVIADAQHSAYNGIVAAMPLADKLYTAGIEPNNVMLIGHSNGAGLMASLAQRLYADEKAAYGNSAPKIQELAALDAPVATASYWQVIAAGSSISRIDNYFVSVTPQTPLQANAAPLGFGAPMTSTTGHITNFALNYAYSVSLSGIAHYEVPLRYAITASATAWGFASSDFIVGGNGNNGAFDGYPLWGETGIAGLFHPLENIATAQIATFQAGLSENVNVGTIKSQYTKEGLILLGNGNWVIGSKVLVCTFLADGAITVSSAVVNAVDIVEQSVTSAIQTVSNIAVSGANFVASGVNSAVQQSVDTVENWFGFTAHSPAYSSLNINVPQYAAYLRFDLTVTDPGNDDQLLVGIGNNVIGQVDLASVQQSGTQTIQLPIGQYAGQTNQTLTFYMPSGVTSTAQFTVGNVQVESLAVDTAPGVSDVTASVGVGGTLAFTAANFTAAFIDPDGNSLQKVMVTSLPQHGALELGGTAVTLDQEIPIASLGTLTFIPTTSYIGLDSFGWNASDGSLYSVAGATVHLTVNAVWIATGGGTFSWGSEATGKAASCRASRATRLCSAARWAAGRRPSRWMPPDP